MKYRYIFAYLRLSQDDEDKRTESNSIQNQRLLIQQYVSQKEEFRGTEILYFVDDGFTGTNFERPGFKQMMERVVSAKECCIIVKDACVIIEPTRKGPFERLSWLGSICF